MTTYELIPIHDGRKSFYNKARVTIEGTTQKLYSYNTHMLTEDNGLITYMNNYEFNSTTTPLRHINEFLRQRFGYSKSKKELLKMMEELNK